MTIKYHSHSAISGVAIIAMTAIGVLLFTPIDIQAAPKGQALSSRRIESKPMVTRVSPEAKLDGVVIKFTDDAKVRRSYARGAAVLQSQTGVTLAEVASALAPYLRDGLVKPLIEESPLELDRRREELQSKTGRLLADLAGYFAIGETDPARAELLVNRLNSLAGVEVAYPAPRPEVAGSVESSTGDFTASQTYLAPAPGGVDADYANTLPGGDGAGVKVIDVEGGWLTSHEDLAGNLPFVQLGGQIGDLSWRNHGTAVVGEMTGVNNAFGIRGIAPGIQWGYSSIGSQSTAGALNNAGANLSPGDVILIELHTPGPHFNFQSREDQLGYVAMEYFSAEFNAIEQLSLSGIIVCEAAGNGAEDFDDETIYQNLFDTTFRNSHAIMCGAGAPPSGLYGPDRSKLGFSNYGERVNLQGYGRGVVTLGYGDLQTGSEDMWYTATFSGTSSASPIVTASVACLQGAYKQAYSSVMTPDDVRTLLNNTGSPQTSGGHIGPRPNLAAALNEVLGVAFTADTTFGQVPLPVSFSGVSTKTVTSWNWTFGDGGTGVVQSPSHTYTTAGLFDVTTSITAVEGPFAATRLQYVAALADTLIGDSVDGAAGQHIRYDVYIRNTLPTRVIQIPINWGTGPWALQFDSTSTVGLRTAYLPDQQLIQFDPFSGTATYKMTTGVGGAVPDLAPGSGPVLSLYFKLPNNATGGPHPILMGQFDTYNPYMQVSRGTILPIIADGQIAICVGAGDANGAGGVDISDALFIITYIFQGGPAPNPLGRGDADCNGGTDIGDVTFIIAYIFQGGAAPCTCAP